MSYLKKTQVFTSKILYRNIEIWAIFVNSVKYGPMTNASLLYFLRYLQKTPAVRRRPRFWKFLSWDFLYPPGPVLIKQES